MKISSKEFITPVSAAPARPEPSLPLTIAGFFIALLGLGCVAVFSYIRFVDYEQDARLVRHAHDVRAALGNVDLLLDEVEIQQRGFLLTGESSFLDAYRKAVGDLPAELGGLQALVASDLYDRRRVDSILPLIELRLAVLDGEVQLGRSGDGEADIRVQIIDRERQSPEGRIRSVLMELRDEQSRVLLQGTERTEAGAGSGKDVLIIGDVASFGLILSVLVLFAEELRTRRRVQEEAQRTAEEFDDLYNRGPFGYHSVDENGVLIRINDTELQWLGYRRDEVVGKMRVLDLLAPEYVEMFRAAFPALKRGESQSVECEFQRRDGSRYPVLLRATAVRDAAGRFTMSRTNVVDITKRKKAEREAQVFNEKLQASVEMLEAANLELESFSYSVSHDLRAPLRAIDGFSRIIERDYSARLDEEGRRLLAIVRSSAKKMAQLIDDLLSLSRLSRHTLSRGVVDMGGLAREAAEEAVRVFEGAPAVAVSIGELPAAYGDKVLLRQVWANLIGNAVKFTSKQASPQLRVSGYRDGGNLVYEVSDNGAGFEMRYAERLFGIFQRLHSQEEYPGTGVGLAIVHRAIHRHGGRIWAESEVDKGATFRFTLRSGDSDAQ